MLDSVSRRRRSDMMVLQRQHRRSSLFSLRGSVLFSVDTPSSSWCVDRVEEVPQIESVVSHGMQIQFSRTPSLGVTGPPGATSISEFPSRQTVGAWASEHQRLMSGSRAQTRFDSHLAIETSRSGSDSASGGSHLVRDQGEDLGEMPRSRYSWRDAKRLDSW
jgi:hypothetical protein